MRKKGFALIEAIVTLFVVAIVGMALLDLLIMARRLHNRQQESAYVQGLLNSALAQTMSAKNPDSQGEGVDYSWVGSRSKMPGYQRALVTVTQGRSKFSGELVRLD